MSSMLKKKNELRCLFAQEISKWLLGFLPLFKRFGNLSVFFY